MKVVRNYSPDYCGILPFHKKFKENNRKEQWKVIFKIVSEALMDKITIQHQLYLYRSLNLFFIINMKSDLCRVINRKIK